MFIFFAKNKANYEKGQIFPIIIAVIVLVMIMAMITANLGKIAIFRTDVANAADAGALAGASTLSSTLLGYGLTSDMWAAKGLINALRMTCILAIGYDFGITGLSEGGSGQYEYSSGSSSSYDKFANDVVACIQIFIYQLIEYFTDYVTAMENGQMAWCNAKQKALSFAFNNVNVDQPPKVKFKNYGGSYDQYVVDESVQNGFYHFMRHQKTGYSQNLLQNLDNQEIKPGSGLCDVNTESGYGWTEHADGSFSESYPNDNTGYANYDNYVKVKVSGSIIYPVEMLSFADYWEGTGVVTALTVAVLIGTLVKYIKQFGSNWISIIIAIILAIAVTAAYRGMLEILPVGFTFDDGDMAGQTTNNPITVEVWRHKASKPTGLWTFQYGDVHAKSAAHAYPENSNITIEPVLIDAFKNIDDLFSVSGSADIFDQYTDIDLEDLVDIETLLCMGLSFDAAWSTLINPTRWLELAFEYTIIDALCSESTDLGLDTDSMSTSLISDNVFSSSDDANDWFNTGYHLFETELVQGFIQ